MKPELERLAELLEPGGGGVVVLLGGDFELEREFVQRYGPWYRRVLRVPAGSRAAFPVEVEPRDLLVLEGAAGVDVIGDLVPLGAAPILVTTESATWAGVGETVLDIPEGAEMALAVLAILAVRPVPWAVLGDEAAMISLCEAGLVKRVDGGFAMDPGIRAAVLEDARAWELAIEEVANVEVGMAELALAAVPEKADLSKQAARRAVAVLERSGLLLAERGARGEAVAHLERAFEQARWTDEEVRVRCHLEAVKNGFSRADAGMLAAAKEKDRQWKEGRAKKLREDGLAYGLKGQLEQARDAYWMSMVLREEISGREHPEFAELLSYAALIDQSLGEPKEALRKARLSLEIRRRILPEDHLDLANSYNNLGMILSQQGQYDEALSHCGEAIRIFRRGSDPVSAATSTANLAILLERIGDYAEARVYYQRSIEDFAKGLGEEHPDTNRVRASYAKLLYRTGEQEAAVAMARLAYRHHSEQLGEAHPWTRDSAERLAEVTAAPE